jgi:hypothetical protein
MMNCSKVFLVSVTVVESLLIAGCSSNAYFPDAGANPVAAETSSPPIQGSVFGGHAPVVGARVYVLSPSLGGFAGPGIAASIANLSKSLMCGDTPATACTASGSGNGAVTTGGVNGYSYVTTDGNGAFNLTGDYSCSINQTVYIAAVGGTTQDDATGTTYANPAIANMAVLGICPSSGNFSTTGNGAIPYIYMNEVSTTAAAYALAAFGTDAFHIGVLDNDQADSQYTRNGVTGDSRASYTKNGLKQAFYNAYNLYDITGSNLTTVVYGEGHIASPVTPGGNGVVPQAEIDTIGNILAACVDSANTATQQSAQCQVLFNNTTSNGIPVGTTGAGTAPTDIASAAFNLAHFPAGVQNPGFVRALYSVPTASVPFSPHLTVQPNDFTIELKFTLTNAGGTNLINNPTAISIDGNNYVGSERPNASGQSTTGPEEGIWIANASAVPVKFFARTGLPDAATNSNIANYVTGWQSVAIDFNNNVWLTAPAQNALVETSNYGGAPETNGTPVPNPTGAFRAYTDGFSYPYGASIDASANVYISNATGNNLDKLTSLGVNIPPGGGTGSAPFYTSATYGSNSSDGTWSVLDANGNVYQMDANRFIFAYNPTSGTYAGTSLANSNAGGLTFGSITAGIFGDVSVDHNNYVWVTNSNAAYSPGLYGYNLNHSYAAGTLNGNGSASPAYTIADQGGLNAPCSTAVDGAGTIWVGNAGNASVSAFSAISNGKQLTYSPDSTTGSSNAGNTGGYAPLNPSTPPTCAHPAIDRAGDVWIVFQGASPVSNVVYELVGAAVPVATPIAYAAATNLLGIRP